MALVNTLAIRLEAITSGFSSAFDKAAGTVNQLASRFDNLNKKTGEAKSRADELTRNFNQLDSITSSIGAAFDSVAAASAGAGEGLGAFGDVTDEVLNNARALEASIREFAGGLEEELAGIAGKAAPAAQGLFKIAEEAAALGPKGLPVIDKIIAKLEELNRVPGKSAGAFNVTLDSLKRLRVEAEAVGKPVSLLTRFTQAFIGTVKTGQTPLSAFIEKNKSLGAVFENLKTFVAGLNPVFAAVLAVIGLLAVQVSRAVREMAALGEEMLKISTRTGIAVDTISELRGVAKLVNVDFGELQIGLRNLSKTIGSAARGGKEATQAFADLGLSVRDAVTGKIKPAEQIIDEIADAIKDVQDPSERTALLVGVLGRNAQALVPFFANGSQAIKEMRAEVRAFGGAIGEDFALKANELSDNMGRLRLVNESFKRQIAEAVIPVVNFFLEGILKLILRVKFYANTLDQAVIRMDLFERKLRGQGGSEAATQRLAELKAEAEDLVIAFKAVDADADSAAGKLSKVGEESELASPKVTELKKQIEELAESFEGRFAALTGDVEPLGQSFVALGEKLAALGPKGRQAINIIIARLQDLNRIPSVTAGQFSLTIAKLEELAAQATPLAGLTTEAGKLAEQLEGGASAAIAAATSILEIGSPKSIEQFNALLTKLIELGKAGDEAAQRVARALVPLEGPVFPPEERERREAEFRAAGPQIDPRLLAQRQEDLRRQQFDVGPEAPEGLERVANIFGEIILLTEEAKIGFAALDTLAGGFGQALANVFSAANKKAFVDFFKSLRDQIIAAIAKALILRAILSFLPGGGIFGGLGKILSGKPLETPGVDSFAQSEGARFGQLFARGLRSTFGQTAFAGISANPGTAQVVIEPQIVVQNAGPLARVEWFEKGQEQRLRRRQEELGGAPL